MKRFGWIGLVVLAAMLAVFVVPAMAQESTPIKIGDALVGTADGALPAIFDLTIEEETVLAVRVIALSDGLVPSFRILDANGIMLLDQPNAAQDTDISAAFVPPPGSHAIWVSSANRTPGTFLIVLGGMDIASTPMQQVRAGTASQIGGWAIIDTPAEGGVLQLEGGMMTMLYSADGELAAMVNTGLLGGATLILPPNSGPHYLVTAGDAPGAAISVNLSAGVEGGGVSAPSQPMGLVTATPGSAVVQMVTATSRPATAQPATAFPTPQPTSTQPPAPPPPQPTATDALPPELQPQTPPPMQPVQGAFQQFERGIMIWDGSLDMIFMLYDGNWVSWTADLWNGEALTYPGPTPGGLVAPVNGFGKLWTENAHIRDQLGWATAAEQPYAMLTSQGGSSRHPVYYMSLPDGRVIRASEMGWYFE